MLPNTEKQEAAAKGYQQQSGGAPPTKHLNVSKKKNKIPSPGSSIIN